MKGIFGLILMTTAWLTISACQPRDNPAAEGMPQNESTGASGQRDTMEPVGQESDQQRRDLASEFEGGATSSSSGIATSPEPAGAQPEERQN